MRLSLEDEHVTVYGRHVGGRGGDDEHQLVVKTFSGQYECNPPESLEAWTAADAYPSLAVEKLTKMLTDKKFKAESIRISHIQLSGTMVEFIKLASCLKQCNTLKSVLFCDSRTSLRTGGSVVSLQTGFDSIIGALSKASYLQEVTLQNMPISSETLADLCGSTSIEKLQVMISPSMLPTGIVCGRFIQPMAQRLRTNKTMTDLRILGVLDYDASAHLTNMLKVNKTLKKISLKVKLKPVQNSSQDQLPLIQVIRSPSCSLADLELYVSGSRLDVETYAKSITTALLDNKSLACLNIVFYGMDFQGRGAMVATKTKQLWMEYFEKVLISNCVLEQVMLNHGLVDLSETVKFYLKLNRAGRRNLLRYTGAEIKKKTWNVVASDNGASAATSYVVSEDELWMEALTKLRDDVPCLFHLLSSNPALLCRQNESKMDLPLKRKR